MYFLFPFRNSTPHYYSLIPSDEELTLEMSVFKSLMVAKFTLSTLWLIIYFSVLLFHRHSTQFLSKLNPLLHGIENVEAKTLFSNNWCATK